MKPAALLQGTLDVLILKILHQEPRTGWAVSARLRQMSNEALQVSHGSLYPALHKLEHEGWIAGEWQATETGRQAKVYALTKTGRQELKRETEQWSRLSSAVSAILESA